MSGQLPGEEWPKLDLKLQEEGQVGKCRNKGSGEEGEWPKGARPLQEAMTCF